ncbi:MAG: RAD55 family ATPase [Thermoplasmatota archaeon]
MNDVEIYGNLVKEFIRKMTSPEIGQFRLEISTFRIILERARAQKPVLIQFTLTENGKVINNLDDEEESLDALMIFLQKSLDFISSLIGEELARDIVVNSLKGSIQEIAEQVKGREKLLSYLPAPFDSVVREIAKPASGSDDHNDLVSLFEDIFHGYLKDLSQHTDLSAFKLKLSILREEHELLKHIEIKKNNTIDFDRDIWSRAGEKEVTEALVAAFNSLVGLSTFLMGKEEAVKKATRMIQYYFEGHDDLLMKYHLADILLDGALHHRISTGIGALDHRMGGGLPKGSSVLFLSPPGIERDIFISKMLTSGLSESSSVLMVLSKEPPRSIRMLLRSQGLNPEKLEEEGTLRIVDWFSWRGERIIGVEKEGYALKSSKILSNLGIAINKGLRELSFSSNKVALVHIIGPAMNIFEFTQVYNFIQRLRAKFKEEEMASLFLLESDIMDQERLGRIKEIFDGTIELKKSTDKGAIQREIRVHSMSNIDIDPAPIAFKIRDNQILIDLETGGGPGKKEEKKEEKIGEKQPIEEAGRDEVVLLKNAYPRKIPRKVKMPVGRRDQVRSDQKAKIPDQKTAPVKEASTNTKSRRTKVPVKRDAAGNAKKESVQSKVAKPATKRYIRRIPAKLKQEAGGEKHQETEDIILEAIATIDELLGDHAVDVDKRDPVRLKIHRRRRKN